MHTLNIHNYSTNSTKQIKINNLSDEQFHELEVITSLAQQAPLSKTNEEKLLNYIKLTKCNFLKKLINNQ